MKKLLLATLIIAIAVGGYFYFKPHTGTPKVEIEASQSRPDISNATFNIEGEDVTLKNGSFVAPPSTPDSVVSQDTELTKFISYGDINGDGKNDTVAILTQTGGGSGYFFYLVAYVSGNVQYKGTQGVFIGDRVSPKSISIDNGIIKVTYLDRKPSEPYAADPTILTEKLYTYKNGGLQEK